MSSKNKEFLQQLHDTVVALLQDQNGINDESFNLLYDLVEFFPKSETVEIRKLLDNCHVIDGRFITLESRVLH